MMGDPARSRRIRDRTRPVGRSGHNRPAGSKRSAKMVDFSVGERGPLPRSDRRFDDGRNRRTDRAGPPRDSGRDQATQPGSEHRRGEEELSPRSARLRRPSDNNARSWSLKRNTADGDLGQPVDFLAAEVARMDHDRGDPLTAPWKGPRLRDRHFNRTAETSEWDAAKSRHLGRPGAGVPGARRPHGQTQLSTTCSPGEKVGPERGRPVGSPLIRRQKVGDV